MSLSPGDIRPRTDFDISEFQSCCLWEENGLWEAMEGQDESSIRPLIGLTAIAPDLWDPLTITLVCWLADGEPLFGVCSLQYVDYLNYKRQDLLSVMDFSFYFDGRWIAYNSMWPWHDDVAKAFGRVGEDIFPIAYRSIAVMNGEPIQGVLDAGEYKSTPSSNHVELP